MAMNIGAAGLGFAGQPLKNLSQAKRAAASVMSVVKRVPSIDAFDESGARPGRVAGALELRSVVFAYPTAPQRPACDGLTLRIAGGSMCALVGASGSGKSTVVQLLERFYDPSRGAVLLDGVDLRSLNLGWLRSQMGYVGQEPVLFMGTIAENIAQGKVSGDATEGEIVDAATLANAHDFITTSLGDGYETQVGVRGGKLSGGQKQRIAIARAIIRKPAVLLLDEATSALDNASEKLVQAALDRIVSGRGDGGGGGGRRGTTVSIAHRLSTIRHADQIVVLANGRVVEQGSYGELQAAGGAFARLSAAGSDVPSAHEQEGS